ncbi:MAG: hypothetical protein RIG63_29705 [Coleofasciculus chthonoplastes F3-SA18-01]|uniref:hypothetical protein n=1 Tax=Coleofasciculus chthonoplastes TaxID=64178 RepID=UPI0032FC9F7E
MTRYSRRKFIQGLLTAPVLLALSKGCASSVSPINSTPTPSPWQLGIGEDPARFLAEVKSDPLVKTVAQALSPQFLSGWLNSFDHKQGDLSFWQEWHKQGLLSNWFQQGYTLQVITWEDDTKLPTGEYHISQQFLSDIEELAGYIRQANPQDKPTYWTLATEFSYWRIPADTYNQDTSEYYQALMKNMRQARQIIKQQLPNAWVAPSWGGWIVTFDDPAKGAGLSMIPPFGEFMQQMDGIAFQSMRPKLTGEYNSELRGPDPGNPAQILQCCQVFSDYHKSLMVSHYEPAIKALHPNGGQANTVTEDFLIMMRPEWLKTVTRLGLDKISLMHYGLYKGNPVHALSAVQTFQTIIQEGSWAVT